MIRGGAGLFALVALATTAQVLARPMDAPSPSTVQSAEQYAQERARADRAERNLAIQTAISESEGRRIDRAFSRFEILIGLVSAFFGTLITGIVIFFALRTERAAVAAARKEMEDAKVKIDELSTKAESASIAAEAAAAKASDALAKAEVAATATAGMRERAEVDAAKTAAFYRETAAIGEASAAKHRDSAQRELTEEQTQKLRLAAEDSASMPEADWSVDQFKSAIGKASYVDRNWRESARLASTMALVHAGDPGAKAYALNRRGEAETNLAEFEAALQSYEEAITIADPDFPDEMTWAMHHKGFVLVQLDRPADAEAEFVSLLPLLETKYGKESPEMVLALGNLAQAFIEQGRAESAEQILVELVPLSEGVCGKLDSAALVVRYDFARALLRQDRASEAEKMLRELLPLFEKVVGATHAWTFVVRYVLSEATLENGDAVSASSILEPIPVMVQDSDWSPRHSAKLCFVRARVADALGEHIQADVWLAKSASHFAACYRPDSLERARFNAYVESRKPPGGTVA